MKVYFVRHAETTYNVKKLVNQNPKIKVFLTKRGVNQAKYVANKLKKIKFDVIFVSDFVRTQQTANIINKFHNVKIIVDKRISEGKTGSKFEGKSEKKYQKISKGSFDFKLNDGESWKDVVKRVENFINFLKKKNYKNVLVITHEWVLRAANKIVNNLSFEEGYRKRFRNCEILKFKLAKNKN